MTTKKQSDDGEERAISVASEELLAETTYDPERNLTAFAISKDGKISMARTVSNGRNSEVRPMSANDDLIQNHFVRFASKPEPYSSLEALYQETRAFIERYMLLPKELLTVSAVYILLTWVHDRFHTLPYLRVTGNFGTGKTRFLEIMSALTYKSMTAGGSISTAAIFRTINLIRGTLIFDEADFKITETWSEIVKILNAGHSKGFPVVRMNVSQKNEMRTETFYVFGPKILASREPFQDQALESRILSQNLLPMTEVNRPIILPKEFESEALELRNKLLAFRLKSYREIQEDPSTVGTLVVPRIKQISLALTSIANLVSKEVLEEVLVFVRECEQQIQLSQKIDLNADVIISICKCIADKDANKGGKVYMRDIAMKFRERFSIEYGQDSSYDTDDVLGSKFSLAKKMGKHVRSLGFTKYRDSEGIYILIPKESDRINLLVQRYGLKDIVDRLDQEPQF